jgi:omega-6 fatty acid desaturase (delta-12 desaturase)
MQAHATEVPQHRDARFHELMEQMRTLQGQSLAAAIPRELYEPRLARGLLGFFTSYALWVGGIIGVALAPHPLLYLPLWLLSGLGGWGLHCIAHDCGHGSFSRSQRLNSLIGHLSLMPLVYPFHAWKHVHNLHHANTNSLEKDTDWRPVDVLTFQRMPLLDKAVYVGTRSVFFWMGTVHYWLVSGFRPGFFPQAKARAEVRRSIVYVVLFSAVLVPALVYATGWMGLLKYFVGPWLGIHAWFSTTTLMHHTTEDLPFLRQKDWSLMGSKLLLTTDYRYPKFLLFLTHNISIHAAHHVAPKLPFYNLLQAQEALKSSFPGMLREKDFSSIPRELIHAVTRCHLYDPETGYYHSFFEKPGAAVEAPTVASS